jgi:uncharacterized SAM-binding protein YcdF (DUF218 family)
VNFVAVKLVSLVVLPSALLVELVTAGWLLRRWWLGRALLALGVLGLAACLLLPVDSWAIRPLEDQFPPINQDPPRLDGIIVLGGSIDDLTSLDRGTPIIAAAANRLTTFLILAKRYPAAKLVFTGGSGQIEQVTNEAHFARILLADLGLPPSRVVFEDKSRTTAENATLSRDLVHPAPGEIWALVTSASHMPRSVAVFRAAGWNVLPWPAGYISRDNLTRLSPSLGGKLATLDLAAHEWEGLLYYWLAGKTNSLLPTPAND